MRKRIGTQFNSLSSRSYSVCNDIVLIVSIDVRVCIILTAFFLPPAAVQIASTCYICACTVQLAVHCTGYAEHVGCIECGMLPVLLWSIDINFKLDRH